MNNPNHEAESLDQNNSLKPFEVITDLLQSFGEIHNENV